MDKEKKTFKEILRERVENVKGNIIIADMFYKKYYLEKTEQNKHRLIDAIKAFYYNSSSWADCKGHEQGGQSRYESLKYCNYLSTFKSYLCRKAIKDLDKELKNDPENPIDVEILIDFLHEHNKELEGHVVNK